MRHLLRKCVCWRWMIVRKDDQSPQFGALREFGGTIAAVHQVLGGDVSC